MGNQEGTVKWFNDKKGFGFIVGDDEKDYFVHFSEIKSEDKKFKTLAEGDRVEFEASKTERGLCAKSVKKI